MVAKEKKPLPYFLHSTVYIVQNISGQVMHKILEDCDDLCHEAAKAQIVNNCSKGLLKPKND